MSITGVPFQRVQSFHFEHVSFPLDEFHHCKTYWVGPSPSANCENANDVCIIPRTECHLFPLFNWCLVHPEQHHQVRVIINSQQAFFELFQNLYFRNNVSTIAFNLFFSQICPDITNRNNLYVFDRHFWHWQLRNSLRAPI